MERSRALSRLRYTLGYILFAILFSIVTVAMVIFSLSFSKKTASGASKDDSSASGGRIIVIDAGHGGEDGGAVGKNGVYEKELNLIIAKDLAQMLVANGNTVILTRDSDVMLYDRNVDYRGRKKMLDLAARLKIGEECEGCVFVSIHMNTFPEERYRGLQVYYSPNDDASALLAEKIQSSVCDQLQPTNDREIKKANSSIFILDRIKRPAVLIECGFISNPEECALLCSEEYRQKLTLAIFCGICEYFSGDNS